MNYGICKKCKKFYQKERNSQEICSSCISEILFGNTEKPNMNNIMEISRLAKQCGMTY